MSSLLDLIKHKCQIAVEKVYPELADQPIEVAAVSQSNKSAFGDYQFNSAMKFSKILKKSPVEIANNILPVLTADTKDIFSGINIAGPGFINFILANDFLAKHVQLFLQHNKFYWRRPVAINKFVNNKVVIDFSSPNIAKEMHVGHLRSTIIGDCIARILEYLDYQVVRVNHIGDWGTQFGMLIAYLKLNNKLSNHNNIEDSLNLTNLIKYYQEAKHLFDQNQEFKKTAQTEVVALQRHDKQSLAIWQKICSISAENYSKIYQLLDINITDKGESFYHEMLPQIINDFNQQGLITESEGAQCVYLPGFVGRDNSSLPLMIQKSDGGYNYATTDLAAIKYRIQEEQANWLIYVTDSGQSLHFKMLLAAAVQVGYLNEQNTKFSHVPFGLVLRADGKKFKTREGDTEKLIDLIDNAIATAKNILLAREEKLTEQELDSLANKLGINAIKYADLSNNRNSNYVFDYDKMLQFNGNTAAFLSYAYVRINSIKNKIAADINNLINSVTFKISNQYERDLALRICRFSEVLLVTAEELLPNRLTDYLYLLAEEFHAFFHHCKVVGSDSQDNRLLLCEATANIIKLGFSLLGLKIINKM